MRILLTNCSLGQAQRPVFPLGLAYIASGLGQHEVICFDSAVAQHPLPELTEVVSRFKPEIIGLSLRNIDTLQSYDVVSYWPFFVETTKHLRASCPGAVLVAGGAGFSLFADEIMKQVPEIDLGIYLEGELSFPELLDNLGHPQAVPGVYYRHDDQVFFSGARELLDFDSLPMPHRDLFDLSAYKGPQGIGVQTKRGCVLDCMYCTYPFLSGHRLRRRSPEKVADEVERLRKEYDIREVFFADDIFNQPPAHARAICQELADRKLDVQWTAYFSERGITADFVELALEAGCAKFLFSPDGYNDAGLATLGKKMSREQIETTYRLLATFPQARFKCDFIWNYPQTGWRDLRDLATLAFRLVRAKNVVGLSISTMRILPNTRLHSIAVQEKRIEPDDPLLLPVFYDPHPWRLVSLLISGLGRMLKAIKRRTGKTVFRRSWKTADGH